MAAACLGPLMGHSPADTQSAPASLQTGGLLPESSPTVWRFSALEAFHITCDAVLLSM